MLPVRSHWHIAPQRDPWREARLLFVNAQGGSNSASEDDDENDDDSNEQNAENDPQQQSSEAATAEGREANEHAEDEQEEDPIDDIQQDARRQTESAMGTADAEEQNILTPRNIAKEVEKMRSQLTELYERIVSINRLLTKFPPTKEVKKARAEWQVSEMHIHSQIGVIGEAVHMLGTIQDFSDGILSPMEFINAVQAYRTSVAQNESDSEKPAVEETDPDVAEARKLVERTRGRTQASEDGTSFPDIVSIESWQNYDRLYNQRTKIEAIQAVMDALKIDRELHEIHRYVEGMKETLEVTKIKGATKQLEADLKENIDAMEAEKQPLTIEFYSVMDFYKAGKNWMEAFKNGWDNTSRLRAGKLQHMIGSRLRWLPYGEQAYQASLSQLDSENNKVKGEIREIYNNKSPKFTDLFGPGKEFRSIVRGQVDTNRFLALIEYAADKGFLYTLRDDKMIDGVNIVQFLPSHWEPGRKQIYIDNLIGQNQSGAEKSMNDTESQIKKLYDSQDRFLQDFAAYMNDVNFPAAQGVMKAAFDRAIDSDEGPAFAISFYDIVRRNAEVRRYLTPIMIQDFARITAGLGCGTMTNLWTDRSELSKVSKNPAQVPNLLHTGKLGTAIAMAETKMRRLGATENELKKHMKKFLAGKPVTLPKGSVSIWEPDFEFYRSIDDNDALGFINPQSVAKTSDEYFTMDGSEVTLAPTAFFQVLFKTDTRGQWTEQNKFEHFVGRIINDYQELRQAYAGMYFSNPNQHPANIFRNEMKQKIQQAIRENIGKAEQVTEIRTKRGAKLQSTFAVAALDALGFINLDEMGPKGHQVKQRIQNSAEMQLENEKLLDSMKLNESQHHSGRSAA